MATKKSSNKLDEVTRLLREQLREIEHEQRDLQKAKDRVLRALKLFVKETPQGTGPQGERYPDAHYRRPNQGPVRHDSHIVLIKAIKGYYKEGVDFHFSDAVRLGMNSGLREGQAKGGIQTCYEMGMLTRTRKGYYHWGNPPEVPNGEA